MTVTSGTPNAQLKQVSESDLPDSQTESAGSIPSSAHTVIRSTTKAQASETLSPAWALIVPGLRGPRANDRSGQDLGLLTLELLGRDDTPVAQVSELGQLVCGAGLRGLLDVAAELLVLALESLADGGARL